MGISVGIFLIGLGVSSTAAMVLGPLIFSTAISLGVSFAESDEGGAPRLLRPKVNA